MPSLCVMWWLILWGGFDVCGSAYGVSCGVCGGVLGGACGDEYACLCGVK